MEASSMSEKDEGDVATATIKRKMRELALARSMLRR